MATLLNSVDRDNFHHCRKFYLKVPQVKNVPQPIFLKFIKNKKYLIGQLKFSILFSGKSKHLFPTAEKD